MNNKKNKSKQTWLIALAIMAAISATNVITGTNGQLLQKTFAENYLFGTNANPTSTSSSAPMKATVFKTVTQTNQQTRNFG